jgi:hypothetical protein
MKPVAWYDPTNGAVSTDKDSPVFTPLGQVLPLYSQLEQEPVAHINVEQRKLEWAKYMSWDTPTVVNLPKIPLYATPPQHPWAVLTDKEIEAIWKVALFADYGVGAELSNQPFVHYARAIEAKLKEKNERTI